MGEVEFDFEGALHLARELHDLSSWLSTATDERDGAAGEASVAWRGSYGDEFRLRAQADADEGDLVADALAAAAGDWAGAWAAAMTEQNRRNRLVRVAEISEARGVGEQVVDWFVGDDSAAQVAEAEVVARPEAPEFLATARPQRFD